MENRESKFGTINYYNNNLGFGFIIPEGETEKERCFFHISNWMDQPEPKKGMTVVYTPDKGRGSKPAAKNVMVDNWKGQWVDEVGN